jgi:hypothetical protein
MRICLLGVGIILLGGAAVGVSGCSSKTCTLRGCTDGFSATVGSGEIGSLPNGTHRLEVIADAASLTCTFQIPLGTTAPACSTGLSVLVAPAGQGVETITVAGTPGQVHAWQYVDDVPILDAAAAPSYEENRPNGPECEPVCRQASASWTLQ